MIYIKIKIFKKNICHRLIDVNFFLICIMSFNLKLNIIELSRSLVDIYFSKIYQSFVYYTDRPSYAIMLFETDLNSLLCLLEFGHFNFSNFNPPSQQL